MTLKLYSEVGSGSCRRVNAVIQYLGIEVEVITIDLLTGGNRTEEFLALNASGMVPVLVDTMPNGDDILLTEASAIMIYLCENYASTPTQETELWPTDNKRFEITKWMFWAAEHFRQSAPIYFEEKLIAPLMGNDENQHRLAEADRLLARFARILDTHLNERDYVVGDQVTLADFDLAAALSQMPRTHIPYEKFHNIMRWEKNLNKNVDAWRVTGEELNTRMEKALMA